MRNAISYLHGLPWIEIDGTALSFAADASYVYRRVVDKSGRFCRYYFAMRDAVIGRWQPSVCEPRVAAWHQPRWQRDGWRPVRWSESAWCYRLAGCDAGVVEEVAPGGRPEYTLIAPSSGRRMWGRIMWHSITEAITGALAAASSAADAETKPCTLVPGL